MVPFQHKLLKLLLVASLLLVCTGGPYDEGYDRLPVPQFTTHAVFVPTKQSTKELQCLTRAIYYEAGGESRQGKEAVALVIVNRMVHSRYPRTVCGVVTQSFVINEKRICQFSFHCEPKRGVYQKAWNESYNIAKRVLTNTFDRAILSEVGDSTYFHANYVHPQWSKQKVFVTAIDHHLFYREPRS
jgi:spore germination cell wall hydrolase CwlJ-like protein